MNILWAVKGQTHESWGMHFSKVLTQRPKKEPRRGRYPQTHNPLNVVVGAVSTQNMLNHSKSASYNPHLSTGKPSPLRGCTDKGCLVWDHPKRWRLKTIFSWIPDSWGTPRLASTQKRLQDLFWYSTDLYIHWSYERREISPTVQHLSMVLQMRSHSPLCRFILRGR